MARTNSPIKKRKKEKKTTTKPAASKFPLGRVTPVVGATVEVDFSNWNKYQDRDTATYPCRIVAKGKRSGTFQMRIVHFPIPNCLTDDVDFYDDGKEGGRLEDVTKEIFLATEDRMRPLRLSDQRTQYKVGDRIEGAWRCNDESPIGWWKATVTGVNCNKDQEMIRVQFDYTAQGWEHHNNMLISTNAVRPLMELE
jgi:hypothetical protein